MYEILRLRTTDRKDKEDYTHYRLDVKKRLNTPFQVIECLFYLYGLHSLKFSPCV